MKLRNKKTGKVTEIEEIDLVVWNTERDCYESFEEYHSLAELNEEWEDYKPAEPLIKDEEIRKAVKAWAEANGLEHFTVINEHFNCCKIMGRKDNRVSKIEFLTTIPNTTHRTYTIDELCGEEAPEPLEPSFIDLDERIREKEDE